LRPGPLFGRRVIAFQERWLGALVLLTTLAACDRAHGHQERAAARSAAYAAPRSSASLDTRAVTAEAGDAAAVVDVDAARPAAPIRMAVGAVLRIRLPASPASGYGWGLEPELPGFLRMESDPGLETTSPARRGSGAGTMNTWSFRAERHGRGMLRFTYRRPWDSSSAPARVATFDVAAH
jgi:predicted secreted protein